VSSGRVAVSLSSGERIVVQGTLEDVEKRLSDAARSASSRLAWFEQADGERIAINPSHVTSLTGGDPA
jgi:hypothetical protein